MQALYGPNSSQEKDLRTYIEGAHGRGSPGNELILTTCIQIIRGALISIKAELEAGFVGSLRATLTGEVLTDLIKLARATLTEKGEDAKNVASVLTAAAFEDTLRKLGDLKGLGEPEKLMDLLTALKDAGVLQGAEVGIAQSYLNFRNRALHAKWDEVDRPSVESALTFTQQIILKHLS
jgi:hypothetical protein